MAKKRMNWNIPTQLFSVDKATEGGLGYSCMSMLNDAGIPCRKAHSIYVGQVGIEVPMEFADKAEDILFD